MVLAQICFAAAWAIIKWIGKDIPLFEVVFFRAFLSLFILVPIMIKRGSEFKGSRYDLLILRGVLGFVGMTATFYALTKMHLGDATVLFNTFPLFIALFAPLLIKEKFIRSHFLFIILAFVGVSLIIKPSYTIFNSASFIGLMAGVITGFTMITVRKLTETDGSFTITFYFTTIVALGAAPFMAAEFVLPSISTFLLMTCIAVAVTAGQLLNVKAYSYDHASVISPFGYASVLCSYILGIVIWNEIPDLLSILGGILVVIAGVAITMSRGRFKQGLPT